MGRVKSHSGHRLLPIIAALALAALSLVSISTAAWGAPTGWITGTITNAETGDSLVGATVYLPLLGRGVAADAGGRFELTNLRPGFYAVEVSIIGYVTWRRENVPIRSDEETVLDVSLRPTILPLGEEIVVVGRRALIELNEPSTRRVLRIAELAATSAATITEILKRQPGVTQVDREVHIRGGRTYEIGYTVDGVSVSDPFLRQGMGVRLPPAVVERLDIQTGGMDASQGSASAGLVAVQTRNPGSRLAGSIGYLTDHLSPVDEGNWNSDEIELALSGPLTALGLWRRDTDARFAPGFVLNLRGNLTDTHLGRGDPYSSVWGGETWAPRSTNDYHALAKFVWRPNRRHRLVLLFTGETTIDQDRSVIDTRLRTASYSYGWPYEYARHLKNYNTFTRQANMQMGRWEYRPGEASTLALTLARVFTRLHSDVNGKSPDEYEPPQDNGPITIEPSPDSQYFTVSPNDGFFDAGDGDLWYDHYVETYSLKGRWELAPRANWNVQTGLDGEAQEMQVVDIFRPWLGLGGLNTDHYRVSPSSAVWWGQGRVNLDGAVLDFGLRGEVWLPGLYLEDAVADTTLPNITEGMREEFIEGTFDLFGRRARGWLLPRLGISWAMGPAASVFVTYDRLVQKPNPRYLYAKLRTRSPATFQLFGNPALRPQKTTAIEGGVRWMRGQDLALTVSFYQRDVTDYVAATVVLPDSASTEDFWYAYSNQDFGQSRGIELTLDGRVGSTFRLSAMGSFAKVEAKESLPSDVFRGIGTGESKVVIQEVRLDWDKPWRTTADMSLSFGPDDRPRLLGVGLWNDWNLNVSFWAEAGKRYTPYTDSIAIGFDTLYVRAGAPNSQLGPYWSSLDLSWHKRFAFGRSTLTFIMKVSNLLNHRNVTLVNPVTGGAYEAGEPIPKGDNFFETPTESYNLPIWDDPAAYESPVHWQIGLRWSW